MMMSEIKEDVPQSLLRQGAEAVSSLFADVLCLCRLGAVMCHSTAHLQERLRESSLCGEGAVQEEVPNSGAR